MTTHEDIEFERLYGHWAPMTPKEAGELMAGYDAAWWIAGGYAMEAFTNTSRPHHDIDVVIWRSDIDRFRHRLEGRYHLWSAGGGMLRPLNDAFPELHDRSSQIWVRTDASSPWLLDVLVNERSDGLWVFKRHPEWRYTLEDVTWVDETGIRYLRPEYVLAMKALHARSQDDTDLRAALPLLSDDARSWLRQAVEELYPDHRWLEEI